MIDLFLTYNEMAILISIGVNIIISILGIIPSFFLTAANLLVFGFWGGTLVSVLGESLGAYISFVLYRKGFKKYTEKRISNHPYLQKLSKTKGMEAFYLILSLRIFPFMPSGFVTFSAAIGNVSVLTFILASSIGKLPALLLEAYSVYQIIHWNSQGKILMGLVSGVLIIFVLRKVLKN